MYIDGREIGANGLFIGVLEHFVVPNMFGIELVVSTLEVFFINCASYYDNKTFCMKVVLCIKESFLLCKFPSIMESSQHLCANYDNKTFCMKVVLCIKESFLLCLLCVLFPNGFTIHCITLWRFLFSGHVVPILWTLHWSLTVPHLLFMQLLLWAHS